MTIAGSTSRAHDASRSKASLLDEDGELSPKFEAALIRIFARFSSSYKGKNPSIEASSIDAEIPRPAKGDVLTEEDLDSFAIVTNGSALPKESKEEIKEFLDTNEDGDLTFSGFCEMFHLQSDNEPEETWKDLKKLGFDDQLDFLGSSSLAQAPDSGAVSDADSKDAKPAS